MCSYARGSFSRPHSRALDSYWPLFRSGLLCDLAYINVQVDLSFAALDVESSYGALDGNSCHWAPDFG